MKIISWNVNSVRARITNIVDYIKQSDPDILLLQEIKTQDTSFPYEDFKNFGYNSYVFGQKSYNGVAIISKQELDKISVPRFYASKVAEVSKIDIKEDYVCYKRGYADSIAVKNAGFPRNFEDGWGATRGTVFDASIIAYWMGFKEIYLLGVDYDYSDKNNTHFYESGEREKLLVAENKITDPNKKAFQRVIKTVAVIKNHLNKNGVVYKNLSKGFLHKNMMDTDTLENIIK